MTKLTEEKRVEWKAFFEDTEVICMICEERIEFSTKGGWGDIQNVEKDKVAFFHMDCWDEKTDYKFPGAVKPDER